MATIGKRIDELTQEYIDIYHDLVNTPTFADKAENIALTDPITKRFIWNSVYDNVVAHIEASQK